MNAHKKTHFVLCILNSSRCSNMTETDYFINVTFLFVVNILFSFSGICLNLFVILSFWRSTQLRKKLCYFMIMVLSVCDLIAVLTNHPILAVISIFWLMGNFDTRSWLYLYLDIANVFLGFSLAALLVMNVDRYLAISYPIYHQTSVTKNRLLTFLAILIIIEIIMASFSANNFIISHQILVIITFITFIPPMLFINCTLFKIAKKTRNNTIVNNNEHRKIALRKNVSSCLLAVASFIVLSIPAFVYIILRLNTERTWAMKTVKLAAHWSKTIASMNSTFNCLIFYWKNKILRKEGLKILKKLRCRTDR